MTDTTCVRRSSDEICRLVAVSSRNGGVRTTERYGVDQRHRESDSVDGFRRRTERRPSSVGVGEAPRRRFELLCPERTVDLESTALAGLGYLGAVTGSGRRRLVRFGSATTLPYSWKHILYWQDKYWRRMAERCPRIRQSVPRDRRARTERQPVAVQLRRSCGAVRLSVLQFRHVHDCQLR